MLLMAHSKNIVIFFHFNYGKRENIRLSVNISTKKHFPETEILKPVIKPNKLATFNIIILKQTTWEETIIRRTI